MLIEQASSTAVLLEQAGQNGINNGEIAIVGFIVSFVVASAVALFAVRRR